MFFARYDGERLRFSGILAGVSISRKTSNGGVDDRNNEFIYLAGVEGTGHHLVKAVLKQWQATLRSTRQDEKFVHELLSLGRVSVADRWFSTLRINRTEKYNNRQLQIIERLRNFAATLTGKTYFVGRSYPYNAGGFLGRRRSIFNQPNLVSMHNAIGNHFNFRIVYLKRNPTDSCLSTLTRNFEGDPRVACRVHLSSIAELNRQIRKMTAQGVPVHVFDFDDAMKRPKAQVQALGSFLAIENSMLNPEAIDLNRLSKQDAAFRTYVEDFFACQPENSFLS